MRIGAIIIGIILVLFGVWMFTEIKEPLALFIYPILSIIIGICLIIFNSSEEKIEQRKDLKKKKSR